MRKLENEEICKWENEVKATREAPEERINFGKVLNFAKVYTAKMTYRSFRKISEKFERRKGEILVKKGCKEGGGSL